MRVTIGLPFYNNGRTLIQSLQSVFGQTFEDWELILLDDGSTDDSAEIARLVADPRVRLVQDGQNMGLPARLNQITSLARGEYIARLDADDLMHPERIEKQVRYLDDHPEVDLVDTGMYSLDLDNSPIGKRGMHSLEFTPESIISNRLLLHASILGRANWFRSNPYDETFRRCQDHELWCRTAANSHFGRITEPLYFYVEPSRYNVRNYIRSCAADRRIYRRYGPRLIGWFATQRRIWGTYAKASIYKTFSVMGVESLLVRRRSVGLHVQERNAASKIIQKILETPVAGLEEETPRV